MRYLPLLLLLVGCGGEEASGPPPPPPPPPPVATYQSIGTFTEPTFLAAPPGDTSRILVTERAGRVVVLRSGVRQTRPFLDLRTKISAANEDGLYSIAFDPLYATNRRFYAFYTNLNRDIRIVRYVVSSDPDSADESQADTILPIPHPIAGFSLTFGNHHGGQLQFGPNDGKLYVSVGDGGCCGDPQLNGQRTKTLFSGIKPNRRGVTFARERRNLNHHLLFAFDTTRYFPTRGTFIPEFRRRGARR